MKNNDNSVKNKIIYLIDDDKFFSLGLSAQLDGKGYDVFCGSSRGKDLLSDITALKPDILLFGDDKTMSENHNLISIMRTNAPACVMMLLSSLVNDESCFSFHRRLGLSSCVSRKDKFASLYNVIKVVSTGYACFPNNPNDKIKKIDMSELELMLLKSMLQGNDNSGVAKELSVPLKRVSAIKVGLMKRLGVNSTAHLVIKAQQLLAA
ncbi:hypothetical protein [Serratia liquefaciens]|uniref:hypothetical protein n=1 Tax=Serratia liquefaciens TaxID=614 RepID=UPI00165D2C32|nr:hypothetical protein [Serratia liquefaciens]QNQ55448.1 hypothetical protein IAI46_05525 [Serratia liquefaciens]